MALIWPHPRPYRTPANSPWPPLVLAHSGPRYFSISPLNSPVLDLKKRESPLSGVPPAASGGSSCAIRGRFASNWTSSLCARRGPILCPPGFDFSRRVGSCDAAGFRPGWYKIKSLFPLFPLSTYLEPSFCVRICPPLLPGACKLTHSVPSVTLLFSPTQNPDPPGFSRSKYTLIRKTLWTAPDDPAHILLCKYTPSGISTTCKKPQISNVNYNAFHVHRGKMSII